MGAQYQLLRYLLKKHAIVELSEVHAVSSAQAFVQAWKLASQTRDAHCTSFMHDSPSFRFDASRQDLAYREQVNVFVLGDASTFS